MLAALTDDEKALFCILMDPAGIDMAEFLWVDENSEDKCWRARPYQYAWWRCKDQRQIDQSSRDIGKSLGVAMRTCSFPFRWPGGQRAIFAPSQNHLDLLTKVIEDQVTATWLTRQMLRGGRQSIIHSPRFEIIFLNRSQIVGCIPGVGGRGFKGVHAEELELDEAQDLDEPAWKEAFNTVKRHVKDWRFLIHGVTKGVQDTFYRLTLHKSGWTVHRRVAMHRETWTDEERQQFEDEFGGPESPDYKRNILGLHGDSSSPLFPLSALMSCLHYDTPVWVVDGGHVQRIPIGHVCVGDHVLNAVGMGTVVRVLPSRHRKVLRITVDGDRLIATREHRFLSTRGWLRSDELSTGDFLIRGEGLPGLWTADCWTRAYLGRATRTRRSPRRVAGLGRVDSVEVLESGSEEFARLSGGKDTVDCYDLTVSGHPSFAVGRDGIIVHNCADDNELSDYNTKEYKRINITGEDVGPLQGDILQFLDYPIAHTGGKYQRFWAGMDIGRTIAPSEILVLGEYRKGKADDTTLRILLRVHMTRVLEPDQADVIRWLIEQYKPTAFAMDSGGVGHPIYQELKTRQERATLAAEAGGNVEEAAALRQVLDSIKGYDFGSKVPVGIMDPTTEDLDLVKADDEPNYVFRNVKEASTDMLRLLVSENRLEMPWDKDMIGQFQMATFSNNKTGVDEYGRTRRFSEGQDHVLDAARMAAMAYSNYKLEAMVKELLRAKNQKPQEVFISLVGGSW